MERNHRNSITKELEQKTSKKRKPMYDDTGKMLLNGVKLTFEKGFGFNQNPDMRNNSFCIDDNRIIYILAKQIVLYDMLSQNQRIVDSINQQQQFTCFVYFKNIMLEDNAIYSVHAVNKSYPKIVLMNISKNYEHTYVLAHLQKQQKVILISLLNENRHFCLISELNNTYRISIMSVHTKQIYASENLYFKPIGMFVPMNYTKSIFIYSTNQIYSVFLDRDIKLTSMNLKKFIDPSHEKIIEIVPCHHNQLVLYAITNRGFLHFMHVNTATQQISQVQSQFLGTYHEINPENQNQIVKNKIPSAICCNEYNIVIGYQLIPELTLVKINSVSTNKPILQPIKFSCPYLHKIIRMSFAFQTMAVCVEVQVKANDKYGLSTPIQSQFFNDKNQLAIAKENIQNLPSGKIFPVIFNLLLYDTLVETLRSPAQSALSPMLFYGKILDICVLPTKKLILVLSSEPKIKAFKWQHISSTSFDRMLEWETQFNSNDYPSSLDTHPLTFNVAVGFREGIKLFTISSQGLKTSNIQFPLKNCDSVRYSKFGHVLVAGSTNQIILIDSYQHRIVNSIQLSYGYNVKQLTFIDRDMYMFGFFSNGSSMVFSMEGNKVFQVWNKNQKAITSAYDSQYDITIVSYVQGITKLFKGHGSHQLPHLRTYPFDVTKIAISNELSTLFLGFSLGKIRCYQWPFADTKFSKNFTEIDLHKSAVTQLKIIHDLSFLVSGSEDGTVFLSKINAYCDGIVISSSQIMHTFRTMSKNYTSLYYLQNLLCTNNSMKSELQQAIVQLESDKVDFEAQYNQILQAIRQENKRKIQVQQEAKKHLMKQQMEPQQKSLQSLHDKKAKIKEEIQTLNKNRKQSQQNQNEVKLQKMRALYKESDELKQLLKKYQDLYYEQHKNKKQQFQAYQLKQKNKFYEQTSKLQAKCQLMEEKCAGSIIHNQQLMKQQITEGEIYKKTMLAQMDHQLAISKQRGQQLRKSSNKINHEIFKYQDKCKHFLTLISDIQIDLEHAGKKRDLLKQHLVYLNGLLEQKDRQIFQEQKSVKQLQTNNINNYSHQQYLKHKQQQLLAKSLYLERQIQGLYQKYKSFEKTFVSASQQTNQYNTKIHQAKQTIDTLKKKSKILKQTSYQNQYKRTQLLKKILEQFHQTADCTSFSIQVNHIFEDYFESQDLQAQILYEKDVNVENALCGRDQAIKKVINNNNLRKIDDSIRRTILLKLNRQTVSLTCQVNQLRKEKKNLTNKVKQLKTCIQDLRDLDNKQQVSIQQIVPNNISIIRPQNSKSTQRLLPFQIYHHNKSLQKCSVHSNINQKGKSDYQDSTQLPSIIKNSLNSQLHSMGSSRLEGVHEVDDEILM